MIFALAILACLIDSDPDPGRAGSRIRRRKILPAGADALYM
jgi:hypothetical protein